MRRDFRFMRVENDHTEPCKWPWIKLPFGLTVKGANCAQPALWHGLELEEDPETPGKYSALPPSPKDDNRWVGYYIEIYFEADTDVSSWLVRNEFAFSTPGYVWPDTFPYPDCHGETCQDIMV